MLQEGTLVNYMDDFAMPGKMKQELEERTIWFLTTVDKHNLYFKWSKCEFDVEKISILGTVISNGEVRMEEEKIEAIKNWKVPTNMKGVETFLGFANFYQQFIKNFSIIVAPLNQLKGKKKEWKWEEEQQKAFKEIKAAIISELVLVLPRDEGKFKVKTDASNFGIGAILSQQQNRFWHPITFMSKTLMEAERNYEIHNKELLTIIKALQTW
jgi:hypothetical protein